jgi:hypothetical protein
MVIKVEPVKSIGREACDEMQSQGERMPNGRKFDENGAG